MSQYKNKELARKHVVLNPVQWSNKEIRKFCEKAGWVIYKGLKAPMGRAPNLRAKIWWWIGYKTFFPLHWWMIDNNKCKRLREFLKIQ